MIRLTREATLADLDRVPEGRKAEIVNGRLVLLPDACNKSARATFYIARALAQYEVRTGSGWAFPDRAVYTVKLPNRLCFIPDASYCVEAAGHLFEGDGPPTFAVEMRSDTEYGLRAERQMAAKRAEYFEAGTHMVWDVDVLREGFVRAYRKDAPNAPSVFKRGDWAHAEPTLPGFRVDVAQMIEYGHRRPTPGVGEDEP